MWCGVLRGRTWNVVRPTLSSSSGTGMVWGRDLNHGSTSSFVGGAPGTSVPVGSEPGGSGGDRGGEAKICPVAPVFLLGRAAITQRRADDLTNYSTGQHTVYRSLQIEN